MIASHFRCSVNANIKFFGCVSSQVLASQILSFGFLKMFLNFKSNQMKKNISRG